MLNATSNPRLSSRRTPPVRDGRRSFAARLRGCVMRVLAKSPLPFRWLIVPAILFAGLVRSQEIAAPAMHITTQERLETETWWPTMATSPLKAYAGSASCTGCHTDQKTSIPTGMQRAATPGAQAHVLPREAPATFMSGALIYALSADRLGLQLSASNGNRKATQAMDWDIGAGDLAHTFLYKADGHWYQSHASFYTRASVLDITTGLGPTASTSPSDALGNLLSPADTRACFGCHTVHATTSAGLDPAHAEPGVGCESCHGPGRQHVDEMSASKAASARRQPEDRAIYQPAKLSPADSLDFCGACHRSFADAALTIGPQADRVAIRFQPYRLEESRCWRETQNERLTCVACHNPHEPLQREPAAYDHNCLQCHSGVKHDAAEQHVAAVCPVAKHDCTTCHMPKVNFPSMHGEFTDHYIRVAKAGEPLPR